MNSKYNQLLFKGKLFFCSCFIVFFRLSVISFPYSSIFSTKLYTTFLQKITFANLILKK